VERFTPERESFDVELPGGERLAFSFIRGRKSLVSIRNAAHRFAESVTELNCPPEMRPYMTADPETLVWVYFLGHLCTDGGAPEFLRLQHVSPVLFDHLLAKVQAALTGVLEADERERIESAKKESAPVPAGATGSSQHGTSGTSTQES